MVIPAPVVLMPLDPDDKPPMHAGASTAPVPASDSAYWQFYREVALAQLVEWLPATGRVLDLSGAAGFGAELVDRGHEVILVRDDHAAVPMDASGPGLALPVVADAGCLSWLASASVDVLVADSRVLSRCLATEIVVEQFRRVLRPGGHMLVVVDSLMLGLARLADQGRWAELADTAAADVVLVPDDDGVLSRCFGPDELSHLLTEAGLEVDWVRPRSVLTPTTVEQALAPGGRAALRTLVATELTLAAEHQGESTGLHLVASARRPSHRL